MIVYFRQYYWTVFERFKFVNVIRLLQKKPDLKLLLYDLMRRNFFVFPWFVLFYVRIWSICPVHYYPVVKLHSQNAVVE